jgi:hypothetical protein
MVAAMTFEAMKGPSAAGGAELATEGDGGAAGAAGSRLAAAVAEGSGASASAAGGSARWQPASKASAHTASIRTGAFKAVRNVAA